MEHRWGRRQKTDLPVWLDNEAITGTGVLRNLSVTGAFVQTTLSLKLFTIMRVRIPLMTRGNVSPVDATGFIVREDETGVGIEWCDHVAEHSPAPPQSAIWRSRAITP